ncbi:MAG: hypothetical protein DYH05_10355 [Acidobacteria bacterium ACB1]|nr:hypothetical protein [Acidobacteria bacterium ACB1]
MRAIRSFSVLFLALVFAVPVAAQRSNVGSSDPLKVQEGKIASKLMARDMPYRILLPRGYETAKSERYPAIYLLHGLYGSYKNWTEKTKIAEYAAEYGFIIVNPEGANGWYTDSVLTPNDRYESYIIKELIPEIDRKFRTKADRDDRIIAGLSMGGYGSVKFGLKYPDLFTLVGSFSGAFGTSDFTEKGAGERTYRMFINHAVRRILFFRATATLTRFWSSRRSRTNIVNFPGNTIGRSGTIRSGSSSRSRAAALPLKRNRQC